MINKAEAIRLRSLATAGLTSKPMTQEEKDASVTGLRFNTGKLQWGLIDFRALESTVRVLEFGAKKYTADNWKKGLSKKEILESMLRHIFALLRGEEIDPESGLPHIGHIGCNQMFYAYFTQVDSTNARD